MLVLMGLLCILHRLLIGNDSYTILLGIAVDSGIDRVLKTLPRQAQALVPQASWGLGVLIEPSSIVCDSNQ